MAVLGYLPNLKRGLGLAFGTHFLGTKNQTIASDQIGV